MSARKTGKSLDEDPWDIRQTAAYLGFTVGRLYQLNSDGTGPEYYRTGARKGRVFYVPANVRNWRDERVIGQSRTA